MNIYEDFSLQMSQIPTAFIAMECKEKSVGRLILGKAISSRQ